MKPLSVIQPQYFRCAPGELCEGAACCRSPETKPALSVGDYVRLGKHTGQPPEHLWRENGDVFVSLLEAGVYMATLSLLHEPCPYLASDLRCGVHESRPLGCGTFPHIATEDHPERLQTTFRQYRCMQGMVFTDRQREAAGKLRQLMAEEADAEVRLFWENNPPIFSITHENYADFVEQAVEKQEQRDPTASHHRSRRLIQSVKDVEAASTDSQRRAELAAIVKQGGSVDYVSPLLYLLVEERVAQQLAQLPRELLEMYESTTKKWAAIQEEL